MLGGEIFMNEIELRCPHCHKLIGKATASEKSIAKVSIAAPRRKSAKSVTFENKCCKCNNLIYIYLSFID